MYESRLTALPRVRHFLAPVSDAEIPVGYASSPCLRTSMSLVAVNYEIDKYNSDAELSASEQTFHLKPFEYRIIFCHGKQSDLNANRVEVAYNTVFKRDVMSFA